MGWFSASIRLFVFLAAGTLLGWYGGNAQLGLLISCLLVLFYWASQIIRLQYWLQDSRQSPPDLQGVWGEVVARIYKYQRDAIAKEERLQSTVDYLLDSFGSMRDGVVILESNAGMRWCNDAAQDLLGLRYPDDIGQAVSNIVRVPEFIAYLNEGEFSEPLVFETAAERRQHLQLMVTQFAEGDTLLFVRDVSERIRMEQIRRDFVGNVSHELRTPLTVITGYLATFEADPDVLPAPYAKAVTQMVGQAERMESLLKDLLWLSRIESAERGNEAEPVDVGAILGELKDEISNMCPDNPLKLEITSDAKVRGDYRELYSAISNLVFNAYKYSDDGSPVVASWSDEDGNLRFAVTDQGIGVDASCIPRLTERFYRVEDSRSPMTGGTGLGLAIVKHVAASHGATLDIQSKLGEGSTFSLVFPRETWDV